MFRENNFEKLTSPEFAFEGVMRHPDGSIDFDAYRARALHARRLAIASLLRGVFSFLAGAFAGKPTPAARHHAA